MKNLALFVIGVCTSTLLATSTLNICARPIAFSKQDLKCLAANVYHEARGEPFLGQILVARVTLNRVQSDNYPGKICDVVFQPHQFSWTSKTTELIYNNESIQAVYAALSNKSPATHFHSIKVKPRWAKHMKKIAKVGNHVFYQTV